VYTELTNFEDIGQSSTLSVLVLDFIIILRIIIFFITVKATPLNLTSMIRNNNSLSRRTAMIWPTLSRRTSTNDKV